MRVLFVIRPDITQVPGGDVIQMQKTKEALEHLGVQVRLGQAEGRDLAWSDVVHVFGAQTPQVALPALQAARKAGKKTVLSTIWWDLSHAQLAGQVARLGLSIHPGWALVRPFSKLVAETVKRRRMNDVAAALRMSDLLLPNSEEEMAWLVKDFGTGLPSYHVVMNAVDTNVFSPGVTGEGVICCARQEPTKNQLSLIKAVAGLGNTRLTLVGRPGRVPTYAERVRREAKNHGFTLIEDHLPQQEIAEIMRQHAVHALPSFRESPGLSSLEAVSRGLRAVVSSRPFCPVDTYFGEWIGRRVFTCTPYRIDSLQKAISNALQTTETAALSCFPGRLTWKNVGIQTFEAYRRILK